jgi:hypothetical protein
MEAGYRALDGGGVGVRHHGDHGGVLVRPVAEGRGDSAVWSEQTGRGRHQFNDCEQFPKPIAGLRGEEDGYATSPCGT